jgi:hypothetical protein
MQMKFTINSLQSSSPIVDRAIAYINNTPPAISLNKGHGQTFALDAGTSLINCLYSHLEEVKK